MAPNLAVRPYGLGVRSTPRKPAPPTGTNLTRLGSDAVRHAEGAVLAARIHSTALPGTAPLGPGHTCAGTQCRWVCAWC